MNSELTFLEEYDSVTFKYRSPEGNVFVILDYLEGKIFRVHTCAGKHGTAGFAAAEAISRVVTELLLLGQSPREVSRHIVGLTHGDTNRLAFDADSIPDAIGNALCSFSLIE